MKITMQSVTTRLLLSSLILLVAGSALAQTATVEAELRDVESRFQEARQASWHLFAPKAFAEAEKKLDDARDKFAKGGKIEDIRKRLGEATGILGECAQFETSASCCSRTR